MAAPTRGLGAALLAAHPSPSRDGPAVATPLSAEAGALPAEVKSVSSPPQGLPRRVVVADDDRDSADSLAVLLSLKGHQVWTAYDGQEAVEVAARFSPDVVLLDIGMPRLNGYQAARQLRERLGRVRLVALTGWGEESDRRQAAQAGFDDFITKPIELDRLVALLASLEGGQAGGPGAA